VNWSGKQVMSIGTTDSGRNSTLASQGSHSGQIVKSEGWGGIGPTPNAPTFEPFLAEKMWGRSGAGSCGSVLLYGDTG